MADKTVLRSAPFGMAIDTKSHVDFVYRHHSIHRFDRPVTLLTGNARPNMRLMHEFHEIGQGIHTIPSNLEWWLMIIRPWLRDGLDSAEQPIAMASDATLDRRHSGCLRAARVLVTVLTGNFIDSGMNAMAEGNGLCYVHAWRPRPLREADDSDSGDKEEQRNWNQNAVYRSHSSHHGDTTAGRMPFPANISRGHK